jgi:hypothetical protein
MIIAREIGVDGTAMCSSQVTAKPRGAVRYGHSPISRRTPLPLTDSGGALTWNTFLGGDGNDYGYNIDVDTGGNAYVAGESDVSWGSPVRGALRFDI